MTKKKHLQKVREREGFTLVEMIVAIGLFTTTLALIVGIFFQGLRLEGYVTALTEVNSNISLTVEQMAREVRSGYNFETSSVGAVCAASGLDDTLTFRRVKGGSAEPVDVMLSWNEEEKIIERREGASEPTILNASNIQVKRLCFLKNVDVHTPPLDPWRVTFTMTFSSSDTRLADRIVSMETTVSSRILPQELIP